jgi:hypothetical protein
MRGGTGLESCLRETLKLVTLNRQFFSTSVWVLNVWLSELYNIIPPYSNTTTCIQIIGALICYVLRKFDPNSTFGMRFLQKCLLTYPLMESGQTQCNDGLWAGRPGFESRRDKNLLFSTLSRPSLGPTSYQTGTGAPSSRIKGSGVKLTTHLHLVPRPRMVKLYFHSP